MVLLVVVAAMAAACHGPLADVTAHRGLEGCGSTVKTTNDSKPTEVVASNFLPIVRNGNRVSHRIF